MIGIEHIKKEFYNFVGQYNEQDASIKLKIVHTIHVVENAKMIAESLHLETEDILLAMAIGYLHDIGRFEEFKEKNSYDSNTFNHAAYGVKRLFEDGLIRKFIPTSDYDDIIKMAIYNHNRLSIDNSLSSNMLLHAKIIRDADKLDNFRVKMEEKIEDVFPNIIYSTEEVENSKISMPVLESVRKKQCVLIGDRKYPLDYVICILAFVFDLYFDETKKIVLEKDYINLIIDRFYPKQLEERRKMEEIRTIINDFLKV